MVLQVKIQQYEVDVEDRKLLDVMIWHDCCDLTWTMSEDLAKVNCAKS